MFEDPIRRTWNLETGLILQNASNSFPSLDSGGQSNIRRPVKVVILVFLEFLEDFAILLRHNERKHGVNRIATVIVRKGAHQQVIKDVSLSDIRIVLHLIKSPVCKIGRRVVLVSN